MNENERYIAVAMSDGSVYHYAFQMLGRALEGAGGGWRPVGPSRPGWYIRTDADANIEHDLRKTEREQWNVQTRDKRGNVSHAAVQMVSWRRLTQEEHELFTADRPGAGSVYRNALVDRGGRIEYDLERAKECCRKQIRRERANAMQALDAQWMRAVGTEDKEAAALVEAERQAWRDKPADPRIDAAQTIEELKALLP